MCPRIENTQYPACHGVRAASLWRAKKKRNEKNNVKQSVVFPPKRSSTMLYFLVVLVSDYGEKKSVVADTRCACTAYSITSAYNLMKKRILNVVTLFSTQYVI